MLHRSFKAAKCKTSLKLAVARVKLLKNKREAQLKQMKKELAQLLEAGQERTARIRVEHVEREEKTMAAYDLIEIYCELIAARLPIIESQKNCPIDLKEAIASVVFAAPRCSDIPELSDVRKHFTAKYGKEFITSALELRPECGVSRMMIEKLSARAPDGETKMKLLTSIAQEYNVKWDPNEFAEKELKPAEDLLNGPNTFQAAGNVPVVNPPAQLPHKHNPKYESSVDFSERNAAESPRSSQYFEHAYSTMRTSPPEPRTSVNAAEGRASGSSSSKEKSAFPLNRQNWSMEFKDATSAAQAAAESAERASMAARAAAELSSIGNITQKNSTGSQEPFVNNYSDDVPQKSTGPMSKTKHVDDAVDNDDFVRSSSHGVDPRTQEEQRYRNRTENTSGISDSKVDVDSTIDRRPNNSAQFGSRTSFPDDDILVNNLQTADVYSQNSSFGVDVTNRNWHTDKTEKFDFLDEVRMEKQSSEFVAEPLDRQQNRQKTEDNISGKSRMGKQTDQSASISHETAGTGGDILDSKLSMNERDVARCSSSIGQGNMQLGTKQPSFNNYPDAVFDDSGSDDDCNLDAERTYNNHEFNFYGSSSDDRKPPSHISERIRSPRRQGSGSFVDSSMHSHFATEPRSSSEYPESPKEDAVPLQSSEISATFDDSDGLHSDSDEEDASKVKLGGKSDLSSQPLEHPALTTRTESLQINRVHGAIKSTLNKKEATGSNKKPWLHSSSDDLECYDVNSQNDLEAKLYVGGPAQEKQGEHLQSSSLSLAKEVKPTDNFLNTQSSKEFHSPLFEDKMQPTQSSQLSSAKELKVRDDVNAQWLPDNMDDSKFSEALSSEIETGLNFGRLTGGFRNKGYIRPPYKKGPSWNVSSQAREQSDEGTSAITEKPTVQSVIGTSMNSGALHQEQYNQKHVEAQGKISSSTPKTIFDSDSDNETEVSPRKTVGSSGYSQPGLSRRTRDSPKQSQANSLPRFTERGKPSILYDSKPVSKPQYEKVRYGNAGESSLQTGTSEEYSKPQSQMRNTQNSKLSTADITVGQKSTKALPQNEVPVYGESSKISHPSSVVKQPSVLHSSKASMDTKTPKAPTLREDSASRESSLKKASHVHPKLPDYDTFAAHFESLRSNRQSG